MKIRLFVSILAFLLVPFSVHAATVEATDPAPQAEEPQATSEVSLIGLNDPEIDDAEEEEPDCE